MSDAEILEKEFLRGAISLAEALIICVDVGKLMNATSEDMLQALKGVMYDVKNCKDVQELKNLTGNRE